jgi:polar amino acid transport system substrate-binding protein
MGYPRSFQPDTSKAIAELAGTGQLRVGVVAAPAVSTFFVTVDHDRRPQGVTVDLGNALAATLGVPAYFFVAPNSGELTDALESRAIDVAFMPVDDERRRRVDFGPNYFVIESTGLVHGNTSFKTTSDLDRPGVRVVGIANTTTIRSTARAIPSATVLPAKSVDDALDMLRERRADALTLSRDVLEAYRSLVPGSRLLGGHFHTTGIAIAVPKDRPDALAEVSRFLEGVKASGMVRELFDRFGFQADPVAPMEGGT